MIRIAIYLDNRREPCVRILPSFACRDYELDNEIFVACRHIGRAGGSFIRTEMYASREAVEAVVAQYVSEGYEDMTGKQPWHWSQDRGYFQPA